MKIVHIISGLGNGGAEGVLYRLVTHDIKNEHIVISMTDSGKYGPLLLDKGFTVFCLNMQSGKIALKPIYMLYKYLKDINPDIVQTWMYHADLIGGIIARAAGIRNVFWNLRHSNFDINHTKSSTIKIAKVNAKLSNIIPKKIISCAQGAIKAHTDLGYNKDKIVVIENGYDLGTFKVDDNSRSLIREELNIEKYPVLGMVGRYDPQKDHKNLIQALSLVYKKGYKFNLLLVGKDLNEHNIELLNTIDKYGLNEYVHLLDQRSDIHNIMNALDIHILSSAYGEGFPNVVAEAMACKTPCIVTNVGDSALIVDKYGVVVEPCNTIELAEAIITMIDTMSNDKKWIQIKDKCAIHVSNNFSIQSMVLKYNRIWNS